MYYLVSTARRKNAKRHIDKRSEHVEELMRLGELMNIHRYVIEIYTGDWKLCAVRVGDAWESRVEAKQFGSISRECVLPKDDLRYFSDADKIRALFYGAKITHNGRVFWLNTVTAELYAHSVDEHIAGSISGYKVAELDWSTGKFAWKEV